MATIQTENLLGLDNKPLDGWTLLSTTVASSDSTIDIINLSSDYFMYKFVWYGVKPSSDDVDFNIRTSSDNGSSWDSSSSDYAWIWHRVGATGSPAHLLVGDNADGEITVRDSNGNATNESSDWEITCFNPSGTEYTKFKWEGNQMNASTEGNLIFGGGLRLSTTAVDGVRFLFDSGNIASGTLWVYGVKA